MWGGWWGVLGGVLGQVVGLLLWCWGHEFLHREALRGPRIVSFINRRFGRWRNHFALWVTIFALPLFWLIRLLEVFAYPWLVWVLKFPRYNHSEWINVGAALVEQVRRTRAAGGRVVAVGTTVVRAMESATVDGELHPFAGETSIFIVPGYRITSADILLTNFHLPESTLLMLVSAFAGRERVLEAYAHAVAERYRFFSYGDAMLLSRND